MCECYVHTSIPYSYADAKLAAAPMDCVIEWQGKVQAWPLVSIQDDDWPSDREVCLSERKVTLSINPTFLQAGQPKLAKLQLEAQMGMPPHRT